MKRTLTAIAAATLALSALAGAASAQPYGHDNGRHDNGQHDNGYHNGQHDDGYHDNGNHYGARGHDWRRGGRIEHSDWNRGQRVDWRRHHLRQPPRGYEWRQVDNQYVMAAVATGVIASILAASH